MKNFFLAIFAAIAVLCALPVMADTPTADGVCQKIWPYNISGKPSPEVRSLQTILVQNNFKPVSKNGKPDGYFGNLTSLALDAFCKAKTRATIASTETSTKETDLVSKDVSTSISAVAVDVRTGPVLAYATTPKMDSGASYTINPTSAGQSASMNLDLSNQRTPYQLEADLEKDRKGTFSLAVGTMSNVKGDDGNGVKTDFSGSMPVISLGYEPAKINGFRLGKISAEYFGGNIQQPNGTDTKVSSLAFLYSTPEFGARYDDGKCIFCASADLNLFGQFKADWMTPAVTSGPAARRRPGVQIEESYTVKPGLGGINLVTDLPFGGKGATWRAGLSLKNQDHSNGGGFSGNTIWLGLKMKF